MKWKPSRTKARSFAKKMQEIDDFCYKNNISQSKTSDSYYFEINGIKYRVSNHTIESSNARSQDLITGYSRPKYHSDVRSKDVIYIHASKTRIIEIYNDLLAGKKLDARGNRVFSKE